MAKLIILPVYGSEWQEIHDKFGNKYFFRFIDRSTRGVLEIMSEYQSSQDQPKIIELTIRESGYLIADKQIKGFQSPEDFFEWYFERLSSLPNVRIYPSKEELRFKNE